MDPALWRHLGGDLGAEARQHPLGMVARRLGLDHHGSVPARFSPASSTADFTCAEGTGVA